MTSRRSLKGSVEVSADSAASFNLAYICFLFRGLYVVLRGWGVWEGLDQESWLPGTRRTSLAVMPGQYADV